MRWYGQLALVAVLGGAGYAGWLAYKDGSLARLPVVGEYVARLGGQGAGSTAAPQPAATGVDVDTVRTGRIVELRDAVGTVRAYESITVTVKGSGIVEEISFQEGQKVKLGDVLLRLDSDERRADIEQAKAETRRATALRDELKVRLDRAMALNRTGAGTGAQVEDLTAQVRTLESAIASADAKRKAAEARLDDLIIRAPFSGRLGTRSVSLGAYVSPGTRVTTLDDLTRIRLDFSVPENLLSHLKPGNLVRARSVAFGERVFDGKVSLIDPRVDPVTRSMRLTAEFPNADEALRPGMFMSVVLEVTAKDDATVVPEEAVVNEGLRQLVYVVGADNKIERRVISLGQRQGGRTEVTDGLKPGETIVIRGVQRVRPGAIVNPRPIGADAAPQAETAAPRGAADNTRPRSQATPPSSGASAAERRT